MQRLLPILISTVLLGAQAPPDSTAYSVAYFDIVPASRTAAITAIKQYRDASRKDDGFQRIEFFEQAGRPAHFCIIETWANSKDLDTHAIGECQGFARSALQLRTTPVRASFPIAGDPDPTVLHSLRNCLRARPLRVPK